MNLLKLKLMGAVFFSILLSACSSPSSDSVEYIPFKSSSNGGWGLIDSKGNVKFDGEFENEITAANHGAFFARNNEGAWILYSTTEKTLKPIGEPYSQAMAFMAEVTPVVKSGERITLINTKGDVVATLDKVDGVAITECGRFTKDNVAPIKTANNLMGLINTSGEVVIKPIYKGLYPFEGMVACLKDENNDSIVFFDKSGKELSFSLSNDNDKATCVNANGIALIVKGEDGTRRAGVMSFDGKWKFEPTGRIDEITYLGKHYFIYKDKDYKYGVMDYSGNSIIPAKYKELTAVDDSKKFIGYYREDETKEYRILNDKDEIIKSVSADTATYGCLPIFPSVIFSKTEEGEFLMYNSNVKPIEIKTTIRRIEDDCLGDETVRSEFVDVDGIVNKLSIVNNGFLGLTLGMTPKEALVPTYKLYSSQNTSQEGSLMTEQEWNNAYKWRDNMRITGEGEFKEDEANFEYAVQFPDFMSDESDSMFSFANIKSDVIGVNVSGSWRMSAKLFTVLKEKILQFGTPSINSDKELLVKAGSGYWYLVEDNSTVWVILTSNLRTIEPNDYYSSSSSSKYQFNKPWDWTEIEMIRAEAAQGL